MMVLRMNNMERQGEDSAGKTIFMLTFHIWHCWWNRHLKLTV